MTVSDRGGTVRGGVDSKSFLSEERATVWNPLWENAEGELAGKNHSVS